MILLRGGFIKSREAVQLEENTHQNTVSLVVNGSISNLLMRQNNANESESIGGQFVQSCENFVWKHFYC